MSHAVDNELKVNPDNKTYPSVPIDREGIMNFYGKHEVRYAVSFQVIFRLCLEIVRGKKVVFELD